MCTRKRTRMIWPRRANSPVPVRTGFLPSGILRRHALQIADWLLFSRFRTAHLTTALFLLWAGLAGAYLRCLEASWSFKTESVAVFTSIENSNPAQETVHCRESWSGLFRVVLAQHALRKADHLNHDPVETPGRSVAGTVPPLSLEIASVSLSTFPYPSVAIYQSKVVYRI